jgi:hypothetical protein
VRIHIALEIFLPGELGVRAEMFGGFEVHSAGMTGGGTKAHLCSEICVSSLVLDGASHSERRFPSPGTSRRKVDVPVERTFVRVLFILERVVVVG